MNPTRCNLFLADSPQLSIRSTSTSAKTRRTGSTIDDAIELSDDDVEDEVEVHGLDKSYFFTADRVGRSDVLQMCFVKSSN